MHFKKFLQWLCSLFFPLSQLLHTPEDPHVFLPGQIQDAAESMLSLRLFDVNHFLLVDPENTTHTYYTTKPNKCQ